MLETKLTQAVDKSQAVIQSVKELHELTRSMSERQRKLFGAISQGKDELEAILTTKEYRVFNRIVKTVTTFDDRKMDVNKLTLENVHDLSGDSYERLLNLCRAEVKHQLGGMLPENYRQDISEYFRIIAPEAYGVLVELMGDKKMPAAVRLKASMEVLDRAGYESRKTKTEQKMPVSVNILFNAQPKAEANPVYQIPGEDLEARG